MNTRAVVALVLLGVAASAVALARRQPEVLDATGSTAPPPTTAVPRESCVTTECHPQVKSRPFLHGPVRVNGCEGCHSLVDPVRHTYEFVDEQADMCALCHIPETPDAPFLHAPFAEGDCLSCHDPHGSVEPRMLRGEHYVDACSTCHEDMTGAHDSVHGPASVGACGACHEPHASASPKLLLAEGRDLCIGCHVRTEAEIEMARVTHAPVLGDCRVCHEPHATDIPGVLIAEPDALCIQCHQNVASTIEHAQTQHGAVTTKRACLNCHEPHTSEHASLLAYDVQQLCFECHNKAIELPDGSTLVNMKQVIESGSSLHGAITQRGCIECHEIHGGGHRRLLTNEYPSALYYPFSESAYALCFSCHDSALATLERTDAATWFRNGDLNLHFVHVNRDDKGRTCSMCHDAHAASREKHIRDAVPYGPAGWMLPIGYEQLPDGGRCGAGCHQAFEYNRTDPVVYPADRPENWKGEDLIPGALSPPPDRKKDDQRK